MTIPPAFHLRLAAALFALALFLLASCGGGGSSHTAAPPGGSTSTPGATPSAGAAAPPGVVVLPADAPQLSRLRIEPVATRDVAPEEVTSPGRIEVNPNRVSRLVLPVPGRIVRVIPKLGDSITQGSPVIEIESPDAEAAQSAFLQADAAVTQARAFVTKSQADLDRITDLFQNSAVARKEVLNAESLLVQAKTGLAQAEAGRVQAVRRLEILGLKPGAFHERVVVRSPLSGKVLETSVVAGEYRNDTSAPLLTIADLSNIWISSDVPESSIRFCRVGGRVTVELIAFPGETFSARVTHISDTVDPQLRTIKVRAELANPSGRFRPEMSGKVHYADVTVPLPVVPEHAVLQSEGRNIVYVEESRGRFVAREIVIEKQADSNFVVRQGLKAGERIVTVGAVYLRGGI